MHLLRVAYEASVGDANPQNYWTGCQNWDSDVRLYRTCTKVQFLRKRHWKRNFALLIAEGLLGARSVMQYVGGSATAGPRWLRMHAMNW